MLCKRLFSEEPLKECQLEILRPCPQCHVPFRYPLERNSFKALRDQCQPGGHLVYLFALDCFHCKLPLLYLLDNAVLELFQGILVIDVTELGTFVARFDLEDQGKCLRCSNSERVVFVVEETEEDGEFGLPVGS
ncbi:hypothetical protein LINPERPRIM_LOCUS13851, partial [Linum perenne]